MSIERISKETFESTIFPIRIINKLSKNIIRQEIARRMVESPPIPFSFLPPKLRADIAKILAKK